MDSISLQIPSIADNIRIVESFIDNVRESVCFDDDIYGNIMIAVTESVNNAILHGNKSDKSKSVHLNMEYKNAKLTFTIQDEGEGFDFNNLPDPTAIENLYEPGGRGIFLIKNLADEVSFSDKGNTIHLAFNINPSSSYGQN